MAHFLLHCVDKFGMKYVNEDNFEYLAESLQYLYYISVDCSRASCLRFDLNWVYATYCITLSIPGKEGQVLENF